jgi:O-antigen/teichoic acid export membrane protein
MLRFNRQARDFILYLSGSLVVAFVAIIRLPVFTQHFSPAELGLFSLVSITYSYVSILLYNWINTCLYRFYYEHEARGNLYILYSHAWFLFVIASLILAVGSLVWIMLAATHEMKLLLLSGVFFLFTSQWVSVLLVIAKIRGESVRYNIFQSLQAGFSFIVILLLIFRSGWGVQAIFTGQSIINILLILILLIHYRDIARDISISEITGEFTRKMLRYGSVGIISSVGILILVLSDRYIIAGLDSIGHAGIYNQVYQVGQVSVYFLVTVFFNTITPGFNKLLAGYASERGQSLSRYVQIYLLLVLPVAFYVSMFSKEVAEFLLKGQFYDGFSIIPWIVISSFLYGLTMFNETKMKFEHRFKPVVWGIGIACILNIGLNVAGIPVWGYQFAAISTFVAYLFLMIYYYIRDDFHYLKDKEVLRTLFMGLVVLASQWIIDRVLRMIFMLEMNKWMTMVEGLIFMVLYAGLVMKRSKRFV